MALHCTCDLFFVALIDEPIIDDVAAHGVDFSEGAAVKALDGGRYVAGLPVHPEAKDYVTAILGKETKRFLLIGRAALLPGRLLSSI